MKRKPSFLKWIYKTVYGKYVIRRVINHKTKTYKTCNTVDEAIKYRDRLIANNWEPLPLTPEEQARKDEKDYYKYIHIRSKGRQYWVSGKALKGRFHGACNTLEEALYYRDLYHNKDYKDIPKPNTLDLITDNPYIENGLKYPVPERLKFKKPAKLGQGTIVKKGDASYHIYYGSKNNNKRSAYICACRTYEQAYYVRREMQKVNWDRTRLQEILDSYPEYYTKLLYFYQYVVKDYESNNTLWAINVPRQYLPEGKTLVRYSGYNNLEDALHERDFLVEHDWDYDLLVEAIDDTSNPYYDMELPPYPERQIRNIRERNYHTKELNHAAELILEDYTREEVANELNVPSSTLNNWLNRFYNSSWTEFKNIVLAGEDPFTVLTPVKKIYTPDLSRPKPPNFKGYVQECGSKKNPYMVRKDNVQYGNYPTREMAKEVVKKLTACNWDKKELPSIRKSVGFQEPIQRNNIYPASNNQSWTIRKKNSSRKMVYYGCYSSHELAVLVRKGLAINDWDKQLLPSIRSQAEEYLQVKKLLTNNMFSGVYDSSYLEHLCLFDNAHVKDNRNIYFDKSHNAYVVQKSINGERCNYGYYHSRSEALIARSILKENNWNKEALEVINEAFGK